MPEELIKRRGNYRNMLNTIIHPCFLFTFNYNISNLDWKIPIDKTAFLGTMEVYFVYPMESLLWRKTRAFGSAWRFL